MGGKFWLRSVRSYYPMSSEIRVTLGASFLHCAQHANTHIVTGGLDQDTSIVGLRELDSVWRRFVIEYIEREHLRCEY